MSNYLVMLTIEDNDDEEIDIDYACSISNVLIHLGAMETESTKNISIRPVSEVLPC